MQAGDQAPDFTLYSDEKEPFSLRVARQTGPVVMFFFPAAFSSVCTDELSEVSNTLEDFGDCSVVGISTDSPMTLAAFRDANGLRFPLLSDHDADVCKAYGVKYDRDFTSMELDRIAQRSVFVVDREGVIRHVQIMPHAGKIPDMEADRMAVSELC